MSSRTEMERMRYTMKALEASAQIHASNASAAKAERDSLRAELQKIRYALVDLRNRAAIAHDAAFVTHAIDELLGTVGGAA